MDDRGCVRIDDPRRRAPYLILPEAFTQPWQFNVWAYVHHHVLDHVDLVLGSDDGTRLQITRAEAAAAAGIADENAFANALSVTTGKSFKAWLPEARMQHAMYLLRATRLPIDTIARAVGYSCGPALCRAFTRIVGMTPREYRRWHSPTA